VSIRHETEGREGIPSPLHALTVAAVALGGMLVAGFVYGMVAVSAAVASGYDQKTLEANPRLLPAYSSPTWIAAGAILNEAVVAIALYVAIRWLHASPARVLPLRRPRPSSILAAVLVIFGVAPLADLAGDLCRRWLGSDVTATEIVAGAARGAGPAELAFLIVAIGVAPALVEEAMFRGFVTAAFARSEAAALLLPTLLFAAFHLEPTQVAGTLVLGFGFAVARLCTDSLIPCMVAHAVYNSAVVFTLRYTDLGLPDHPIEPAPIAFGLGLSAFGMALLARERRALRATERPSSL